MKEQIKVILRECIEHCSVYRARKCEINKFKNSKRISIYMAIKLSKEQKMSIDRFYKKYYGKKIPYIWHRHYVAFTGNFDEKYFPELLYIPEFEYYMTPHREYCYAFADKNVISMIANYVGIRTPEVILSKTAGIYRDAERKPISVQQALDKIGEGEMFVKPSVETSSGHGCHVLEMMNGLDIRTGCLAEQILERMGENFVIQKVIRCHETVRKLHPQSVNTFRVITYRWKTDIRCLPVIMRIGVGDSCLDNAHAGGIFVAVENDGTLHKVAFTEFNRQFTEHPDTHISFEGYKIENLDQIITAAKKMHYAVPQIGVVNWDFTLNEDGEAVLVEANMNSGSIWLIEMAHGKGAFGDDTQEILEWLQLIRKTRIDKRKNLYYGKTK